MTAKNFIIYQITDKTAFRNYGFEGYDFAKANGFSREDYTPMWAGEVEGDDDAEMLENLFNEFNMHRPVNFTGHSMSVSDVVELNGVAYYCDRFGWERTQF